MKNESGVSLIESLMVVVMVGVIVALMANLPNAMGLINKSNHLSLAREIASRQIENKRNINYANLVNDESAVVDPRMALLPNSNGTVLVEDCALEICTNEEHVKQVMVTVSWKDNNKNQTITLKTFIGEGGINQ